MPSSTDHIREKLLDVRLKLLDLSKRNRLLNFRHNKGAVKVIDELPKQVFDYLVKSGKPMTFLPLEAPEETEDDASIEGEDKTELTPVEIAELVDVNISDELPEPKIGGEEVPKKHRDNKLQTKLFVETLEASLRRMASKARTIIEETGTNQLYLVLGFLKWKERNDSSGEFEAPLITIPVRLKREEGLDPKTRCYQYTIQYTGEDLIPNLSLREKLRKDFDLILPDFEDERANGEEDGADDLDPEAYFEAIREMVSGMDGWEVRRTIVLGFFSFSKLMMYLDLDSKRWPSGSLEKNPHIHRLFGIEESSTLCGTDSIEKDDESGSFPLIVDADSSQTEAIRYAMNGRSMIIQGPPGTGKSQTITNLIACFLNTGKSVLFLAEKMAALSIVHRNLERTGLADFCLELHSHKANKRDMLDSLQKRRSLKTKDISLNSEARLKGLKESLGKYVLAITRPIGPKGESVYDVLGKSESLRMKLTDPLGLTIQNADCVDETEMQEVLSLLDALSRQYRDVGNPRENTWYGFEPETLVLGDEDKVAGYLKAAQAALLRILAKLETCYSALHVETGPGEIAITNLEAIVQFASGTPPPNLHYDIAAKIFRTDGRRSWEQVRTFQELVHKYRAISAAAKKVFSYPLEMSPDEADAVGKQLDGLLACGIKIIDRSLAESLSRACNKLLTVLQKYDDYAKKELPVALADLQNLRGLDRLELVYTLLQSRPEEIDCIDTSKLFGPLIRSFATILLEEAERLVREREELSSVFAINDVCEVEELTALRKVFRKTGSRFFRSLGKEYRKAKKILCSFVKVDSIIRNRGLADLLERLECFLRDEKKFTEDTCNTPVFSDQWLR